MHGTIREFVLNNSVGFLINRSALRLKRELLHMFRRNGSTTTPEQWALLNRLWEEEGQSQVQLAERTFNDKPNVTRMLGVLERDGLVYRRPNPVDRRAFEVCLTPQGKEIKHQLVACTVEVLERATRGLDEHDIENLKRILRHIDGNLNGEKVSETP